MNESTIKFYDEKIVIVTTILNTTAKALSFDSDRYLALKDELLGVVKNPKYIDLGIPEIVTITTTMIGKLIETNDYVLIEKSVIERFNQTGQPNLVANVPETDNKAASESPPVILKTTKRSDGISENVVGEPSHEARDKLLELIALLPPYVSAVEIQFYSAKIRNEKSGEVAASGPLRTIFDIDQFLAKQAVEAYAYEFNRLLRSEPDAFMDSVEMAAGKSEKIDASAKLRTALTRVKSVREFLSVKGLVDRYIGDYRPSEKVTDKKKNFFWQKKWSFSLLRTWSIDLIFSDYLVGSSHDCFNGAGCFNLTFSFYL